MIEQQAEDPVRSVLELFQQRGYRLYGERVTVLDHSLQTAAFARQDGASDAMVIAALLHDIGHLVRNEQEDIASRGVDTVHERAGADYLTQWFDPEVVEPGRLHVAAKRYLVATDEAYARALSPASAETLELQGGPFTLKQCRAFQKLPYWREALALRRYDDMGKVPGMDVPSLEHYELLLRRYVLTGAGGTQAG